MHFLIKRWLGLTTVIVTYYQYEGSRPVWPLPCNASTRVFVDGRE
jgi:hypothetical protein